MGTVIRWVILGAIVYSGFAVHPVLGLVALVVGAAINGLASSAAEGNKIRAELSRDEARNTASILDDLERASVTHKPKIKQAIADEHSNIEICYGVTVSLRGGKPE